MEYPSPDPVLGTRGRVLGELLTLTHHMPHRAGRGEGSCIMRRKSRLSQGRELASHATLRPPGALARVTCNSVRSKLSHVPEPRALSLHKPRTCKPSVSPASKPFLSASCSSGQSGVWALPGLVLQVSREVALAGVSAVGLLDGCGSGPTKSTASPPHNGKACSPS